MIKSIEKHKHSKGMTLIISMVILITVLFLTVTTMNTTNNATKVTSNSLSEIQADLAAEAAIKEAEELINSGELSSSDFSSDCSTGLCSNMMDGNIWDNIGAWVNSRSTTGSLNSKAKLKTTPKFIIEYLGDKKGTSNSISVGQGYTDNDDVTTAPVYRITGKAKGKHGKKEAVIQSTVH